MIGKNVLIQIIVGLISSFLALLTLSFSARFFGPEIFGRVAYLLGIIGVAFAVSDLGLSRAHIHFTAYKSKPQETLGTFLILKLGLIFFCVMAALLSGIISRQLSVVFLILIGFEVLSRLAEPILITFEGLQQAWPQNLCRLISKIGRLVSLLILALVLKTAVGYSLTFLAEALVLLVAAIIIISKFFPLSFSKDLIKDYVRYSLPFALIMPLSYFQDSSLPLILRHFRSAAELGYFVGAFSLFGFLKTLSGSLMVYFFPKISYLYREGRFDKIQAYTDLAVKFSVIIFLPVLLIFFLLRNQIISLVLGSNFLPAAGAFAWLLVGQLILLIFTPYDHVLFATRNHRPIVWVSLFSLVLIIGLSLILVPQFGATGSAMALVAGWLVSSIWQFLILKQKTKLKFCRDFSFGKKEVKYFRELFYSFSQTSIRSG